jgi:hypothetical protein
VKIILNTQSENDTVTLLQDIVEEALSNGFGTTGDQLTGIDLTSSQEKLLEITVKLKTVKLPEISSYLLAHQLQIFSHC